MALNTNTLKFAGIAIILHGAIIVAIASLNMPTKKESSKTAPMKSYLIVKPPAPEPKPQVQAKEEKTLPEQAVEQTKTETSQPQTKPTKHQTAPQENTTESINDTQPDALTSVNKTTPALSAPVNISQSTAQFLQKLNEKQLQSTTQRALGEYNAPQAIQGKSAPTGQLEYLKRLSDGFAPPESNMVVVSQSGPDQTNVLTKNGCITLIETDLDDKVYRGRQRWTGSNACGKINVFDSQLLKSLNKYLKKK